MTESVPPEDLHAEDQDELDAVLVQENGEPLVDFLEEVPRLVFAPEHPLSDFPRVHLLRKTVAAMLHEAVRRLPPGLKIQIVEGYRPVAVQRFMFRYAVARARERFPEADEAFILKEAGRYSAPPDALTPPPHLTGGAVDLALLDANGHQLDFISPYDQRDLRHAAMNAKGLSPIALENRAVLRSVLEPTGLTNYADEWWHWSYGDNGWALRTGAPHAIYGPVEMPADAHWVGDPAKLPTQETPLPVF